MEKLLKEICPSEKEKEEIKSKVESFLKKLKIEETIKVGGSYAKNTWLSGNHDIDIFVLFPKEDNISDQLEKSLKRYFRSVERIHGSRDYFQVKFKNLNFEIIPVLKIKELKEARNTTDYSPLHVEWIQKNTNKKLCNEIRLVKQFCKGQNIYGAETYINGFSGHVLEILTINKGSFKELIKFISKVKEGTQIGEGNINQSKKSPLIVIDPIDKTRNAAAALSKEKFYIFQKRAKEYLVSPSPTFFKEKRLKKGDLKKKDIILEASPLKGKRDVVGTKLLKAFEYIKRELRDFKVKDSGFYWRGEKVALFWYNLKNKRLNEFRLHYGPPLDKPLDVKKFKQKHKLTFTKENKICTKLKRDFTDPKKFLKNLFKNVEIKTRVKKIKF